MTNSMIMEIARLHSKLSYIYRRGILTASEALEVRGLWARVERLESTQVAVVARESRQQDALGTAKVTEGLV